MIFYTNTGKWDSEIVKAFDIFDMHLVTTCAHASCISSQGDVAAPDIFAWACHMTRPCKNIGRGDVSLGGDTRCVRACRHEMHVKNVKCFHNFAVPFACVRVKNHGEKVKNPIDFVKSAGLSRTKVETSQPAWL